jgi:NAD+ synthase (glutamine-hydrolysing)
MEKLKIAIAQLDFFVGDIPGNAKKIIENAIKARDELKADIVIFPELALTGYPPEDLLLRNDFYQLVKVHINEICQKVDGIYIILGYPEEIEALHYNQVAVIYNGKILITCQKQLLPNYGVFDEKRYFEPGNETCTLKINEISIALTVCEDLWFHGPMAKASAKGAKLMISVNASPFDMYKPFIREKTMSQRAIEGRMPIIYVNCVGGQDELVFDGGSMVLNANGEVTHYVEFFEEKLELIELPIVDGSVQPKITKTLVIPHTEERIYKALVLGVRDYIRKNNFPGAIIGLSGGIDSALTLAIAVDAIGKENVAGLMMPSRYTREMSLIDAKEQANNMGIHYSIISIEPVFTSFLNSLADEFKNLPQDITEENLQARCRGTLLMAISNKKGAIVLSTGNKSEMAVGYSTLYGDMVGGFCVLKDVPKTLVYRLAEYRNKISPIIPQRVLERAPSAELADNQLDQDSLPSYPVLDEILERYVEKDQSFAEIVASGIDKDSVRRVLKMVDRNEYKRRQAPLGVRITARAFGRDRRYPITSGYMKNVYN